MNNDWKGGGEGGEAKKVIYIWSTSFAGQLAVHAHRESIACKRIQQLILLRLSR